MPNKKAAVLEAEHRSRPFEVHDLAADFDLLDVWRLPVEGEEQDFAAFADQMFESEPPTGGLVGMLFQLREALGRLFGWDEPERLPIPGCTETSLVDRLRPRLAAQAPPFDPRLEFQLVYRLPHEQLLEISNGTVHALMHLSWVKEASGAHVGHMAVYCKTRGLLGRAYMALISPFRKLIVYPALLEHIGRRWQQRMVLRAG